MSPNELLGAIQCRLGLHYYEWHPEIDATEDRIQKCVRCGKTIAYRTRWVEMDEEKLLEGSR